MPREVARYLAGVSASDVIDRPAADPDRLKLYAFTVFTKMEGAVTAGMIYLGDHLGLYRTLAEARPAAHQHRAGRAGRPRRAVGARVGLQPGFGPHHRDRRRGGDLRPVARSRRRARRPRTPGVRHGHLRALPDVHGAAEGPTRQLPHRRRATTTTPRGADGAAGIERSFEPWYRNFLVPVALPALDGVVAKLEAGATAADVGCGAGVAVRLMARAFPSEHVPRLRHLAARAHPGRAAASRRGHRQRPVPRRAEGSAARPTTASSSSRRSTASTT